MTCHFDTVCLSGSGAFVNHPEQKGRRRPARPETHRQAKAPHTRSTTGKILFIEQVSLHTFCTINITIVLQEDKYQQKTVVRERLEQLRRERSYVMQSKRDR